MKNIFLFLLLVGCVNATAQIPPMKSNTSVFDYVGKLTVEQNVQLNRMLAAIEAESTVEGAIVLVDAIPEQYGGDAGEYARAIGNSWGVGNAENGFIYLFVLSSRGHSLQVGQRLEQNITDYQAGVIIGNLIPFYKAEDWFGGLQELLRQIQYELSPAAEEQRVIARQREQEQARKNAETTKEVGMWSAIVAAILGLFGFVGYKEHKRREKIAAEKKAKEEFERKEKFLASENVITMKMQLTNTVEGCGKKLDAVQKELGLSIPNALLKDLENLQQLQTAFDAYCNFEVVPLTEGYEQNVEHHYNIISTGFLNARNAAEKFQGALSNIRNGVLFIRDAIAVNRELNSKIQEVKFNITVVENSSKRREFDVLYSNNLHIIQSFLAALPRKIKEENHLHIYSEYEGILSAIRGLFKAVSAQINKEKEAREEARRRAARAAEVARQASMPRTTTTSTWSSPGRIGGGSSFGGSGGFRGGGAAGKW
jgi:uncharacterized membrane protein YgcG